MDITFDSLQELYQRVRPALAVKKAQMHREGYTHIKETDIWNYFKEIKWQKAENLYLHDIVADIINIDSYYIDEYVKDKLKSETRTANFNQ